MKFKLDENLEPGLTGVLLQRGHDAESVLAEGLSGASDTNLHAVCRREARTLITLDLHFANSLRFPVKNTAGIVILRPHRPLVSLIRQLFHTLPVLLQTRSPEGSVWIIEPGRLRIHRPSD